MLSLGIDSELLPENRATSKCKIYDVDTIRSLYISYKNIYFTHNIFICLSKERCSMGKFEYVTNFRRSSQSPAISSVNEHNNEVLDFSIVLIKN